MKTIDEMSFEELKEYAKGLEAEVKRYKEKYFTLTPRYSEGDIVWIIEWQFAWTPKGTISFRAPVSCIIHKVFPGKKGVSYLLKTMSGKKLPCRRSEGIIFGSKVEAEKRIYV